MKKYKHYITEQFDFNGVLDSTNNNDDIINNISNTLALDSIINVIKNTFESTHDYKFSKFTISDDKRIIVVNTKLIYSEYQNLYTRFIINDDNTIYVDYTECKSIKDSINITTLINQILENIQKLLVTPVKCKIRILMSYYNKVHFTSLNEYGTLAVTYNEICFIVGMIKKGYKDISIFNNYMNKMTIDIDKNTLQPYVFGNIEIDIDNGKIDIINNDIIAEFINYAQSYMLPENGYVLFKKLPIYRDTTLIITYLDKVKLCKFNDKDTLSTMQHIKFKITDAEVKLMCRNILYNYTMDLDKTIDKLTFKIPRDKMDKFYARIVLACIISGNISIILDEYNRYSRHKDLLDPLVLKAYYNYVIDDIKNHGPIYNQIINYNV